MTKSSLYSYKAQFTTYCYPGLLLLLTATLVCGRLGAAELVPWQRRAAYHFIHKRITIQRDGGTWRPRVTRPRTEGQRTSRCGVRVSVVGECTRVSKGRQQGQL